MLWENEYSTTWVRRFAWLPQRLDDGLTVWLGLFEQRYVPHAPPGAPAELHAVGYWERRLA